MARRLVPRATTHCDRQVSRVMLTMRPLAHMSRHRIAVLRQHQIAR
jgi:hypothetical protein